MALLGGGLAVSPALAQGYRVRLDTRVQSVGFRGVELDSIALGSTVIGPSGGSYTPDGFAVHCPPGSPFCFFFRPGAAQRAAPAVTAADFTIWGLGLPGLSFHGSARVAVDLGSADVWPGTDPSVQLLEGYAEYNSEWLTGRLGRQVYTSRLGFSGFDGGRVTVRDVKRGFDAVGYLGLGLARGTALPVTSTALNPLDDFQPHDRQIIAGAALGYTGGLADVRLDYQREVDPRSDYFVSERAALATEVRLMPRLALAGGAEYDMAQGLMGSSDVTLRYVAPDLAITGGFQRYRPHFELWTIWGVFSPVAYQAVTGSVSYSGLSHLQLRARGTRFFYEKSETETPLVSVEDHGWRYSIGATWTPTAQLGIELGQEAEFAPGGSYLSYDAAVSYAPRDQLLFTVHGAKLTRPLEFRFDEAALKQVGVEGSWRPSERWQFDVSAARFMEDRKRPDAAAFDWNQTRFSARVSFLFGSGEGVFRLPKGRKPTASGSRTP
ncbi:MAG TPA: hypothetical protein VGP80_13190 [Gemmatimonadales bacterium]|nr:hypothetical protein [Gemmatimonadales bacterium]